MKFFTRIILAIFFSAISALLIAQNDSLPPLPTLLGSLNAAQKSQVLDYAHHLGAYHGKPLEKTCQMLDDKNQKRVAQYIVFLQNPSTPIPTTVHWNLDTLRFMPIDEGTILMDSFVLTNTGSAPYFIREVKSSCDCTALSYPHFPIMPGDSDVVRVEFDSSKKAGHVLPAIILYDNSRPNRRSILYLEGEVKPQGKVKVIIRN